MPRLIIANEGPTGWVAMVENSGGVSYPFSEIGGDAEGCIIQFAHYMNDGQTILRANILKCFDTTQTDPLVVMNDLLATTDEIMYIDQTVCAVQAGATIIDELEFCGAELAAFLA